MTETERLYVQRDMESVQRKGEFVESTADALYGIWQMGEAAK